MFCVEKSLGKTPSPTYVANQLSRWRTTTATGRGAEKMRNCAVKCVVTALGAIYPLTIPNKPGSASPTAH